MNKSCLFLVFLGAICLTGAAKTIKNHLSNLDLERLNKVFTDGLKSNDLQSIYYGSLNLKKIPDTDKQAACKKISELYPDSKLNEFEKNFYFAGAHKQLGCSGALTPSVVASIKSSLDKDGSTTQEVYYNYYGSKILGISVDDSKKAKIAKNLQAIIKKDDSLGSLGHAFNLVTELGSHAAFLNDWIEGTFAQADEVDGKMLQFDGGLSITALILNGAFKLSAALNKPIPLTEDQMLKYTTYLLSRRSVQLAKGASFLLEVLDTISKDKKLSPICIQLIGNGQLQPDSLSINIKIVDILGNAIQPSISSVIGTVAAKPSNTVLVSKAAFTVRSSDKTVYTLDLTSYKPSRGLYSVDVLADNLQQTLVVKILGKVVVNLLEIGVGDVDSTSATKKQTITYPNKLPTPLNADVQQKIVMKAILVDEVTSKAITVHQSFVRFEHLDTHEEIIFVAEQDTTKAYKFDMDVGARSGDFAHHSGTYKVEFIVGDSSLSNSFKWEIGDIQLKFTNEHKKSADNLSIRSPRPEIIHQFREPEKRPPRFVSDLFTGLCAAPLLVLFALWVKLNVNVSNFSFSLSTFGFHLGFGAILSLFVIFWLQLNMFDTLRYLLPIALVTFFCGNRLLRGIAAKRQHEQK